MLRILNFKTMINTVAKLAGDLFDKDKLEMKPTRDGYGLGLIEAGNKDERVVVLCADLTESTRSQAFAEKFPERFIEMGVAEQNMAVVASGLANYGKIPFISSYATFSPGRNNEQIRTNICINNVPVKIAGSHAGLYTGPDGATHQALEDIGLMRMLPHMVAIVPCDVFEAQKATVAAAFNGAPTYIRLARDKSPVLTTIDTPFEVGKALVLREGKDVALIGCGTLVYNMLLVAEDLSKEGIECMIINSHTIKPLDETAIIAAAQKCGAVVSVEEHQVAGGLGSAIAECLARNYPAPQEFIGVQNRFGESGKPDELIEAFGMGIGSIKEAVKKVLLRKETS